MISAMIKSAIVLLAAACAVWALKRQSAAVRHTVWTAGLIGAMAIPICTLTLPSWQPEIFGAAAALFNKITDFSGAAAFAGLTSFRTFWNAAAVLWIAGAAAGLSLILYSAGRLAWVAVGSEPVEDARWSALAEEVRRKLGIRRPVRLLQNRSVPFLGTWGIVVPRVLLPADAETWSDNRIRMVLGHELSHIKRHDWMVQVLADAARAIYWFNPIFWIASNRLRQESEHACDDAVLRLGVGGPQYAEELLAMTRALRSERRLQSPILAMAQPSHLEQRLVAVLNPSLNRLAAAPWAVISVTAVAVALTLPLAAVRSSETSSANVATAAHAAPAAPREAIDGTRAVAKPPELKGAASSRERAPASKAVQPKAVASSNRSREIAPTLFPASLPSTETPPPPYECRVSKSVHETKETNVKSSFGGGPWFINSDRTIWATDQPYVAGREVNTVWLKPAATDIAITGRRLDAEGPELVAKPPVSYNPPYLAVAMSFPEPGCWEVIATAGGSTLTFITSVRQ